MTFTTHNVISDDGTVIGYRQLGIGPGLIIYHGAGRISQNYEKLAVALSDRFTVYIPDRRGRGLSGAEGEGYNLKRATQDLIAIIDVTRAEFIFGHSAGALIALNTLSVNASHTIKKLAVYEPPISINQSFPLAWLSDFEQAIHAGKPKKAMAISLKGLQVVDSIGNMPLWGIILFINLLSLLERKKEKGARMLDLLPTMVADIRMVKELDSQLDHYKNISIPVNLIAGSKSPAYFHQGLNALKAQLKNSEHTIIQGFDHYSPEEKVEALGNRLKDFY